jgi:UDP-N-acetylmuramoyl-L-alanyl-D-glutamate--2,6-diaminopimelate ligase
METIARWLRKLVPTKVADFVRPAYHLVLAVIGETVYRFPGNKLTVIGVTGTNGKSTTANLIASVLEEGGYAVGLATTINYKIGDKAWRNESKMTSLGRFGTYRLLRQMVNAGCTHAVIEVSSHALHWNRVWKVPFQTAVFTNLSRDHLDLHKTMEKYRATKGKLFARLADRGAVKTLAVINADDAEADYFASFGAGRTIYFSASGKPHHSAETLVAEAISSNSAGSHCTAKLDTEVLEVKVALPGRFNVENALAAAAVGLGHGVSAQKIAKGIFKVKEVPGRMESVDAGQPFAIIVDYAHTPDAFDNVLKTLRPLTKRRLIGVFGATGDRDRGKRPDLGRIAAQYCDRLILTEEDPGSEDPAAIIDEVLPGIPPTTDYVIELDRRVAIRKALSEAQAGDTVVLLAKGHETVMAYRDGMKPWSDQTVARDEWKHLSS